MFRILFFLPEILLTVFVWTQVLKPLWQSAPMFPAIRSVFNLLFATKRKFAAETDLKAAVLEKEAERIEEEANKKRTGQESSASTKNAI